MDLSLLIEFVKIAFLVLIALLTAWLRDYYLKKRRGDSYREHVFRERLGLYREIWARYVALTRLLGKTGGSATASRLKEFSMGSRSNRSPNSEALPSTQGVSAEDLLTQIDEFISFVRGNYVLLDAATQEALERAIKVIEGKRHREEVSLDWAELTKCSQSLQGALRSELGFEQLRDIREILG